MKAVEFVEKIRYIKPKYEDLSKFSLPNDFIENELLSFEIQSRENEISDLSSNDELLKLIRLYRMEDFKITSYTFLRSPHMIGNNLIFAQLEIEYLSIDMLTHRVICLDSDETSLLFNVAINGNVFLEVLYAQAKATSAYYSGAKIDECKLSSELSELSGEKESIHFFKWILGCFE